MSELGNIIVAVDFSKGSLHALEYAIRLSRRMKTNIEMVWVDNTTSEESSLATISQDIRNEVKKQFDELIQKHSNDLRGINISYKLRKGKVYREIANHAKSDKCGIIVAGSHGVSGFEQYWIGSNAYRIVSYAPCPVITLRAGYQLKDSIDRIIMPIDSTLETKFKVPFTAKLAGVFGSEVHIVALQTTKVKAVERIITHYAENAASILQNNQIRFQLKTLHTDNVTNAIIEYAGECNADLISIMTERESAPGLMNMGVFAQQLINNSLIPVLTMNSRDSA